MHFYTTKNSNLIPHGIRESFYLVLDNWDDWFKYTTQYHLMFVNSADEKIYIGSIKIGKVSQSRAPDLPLSFNSLSEEFFSVGQDVSYYENLKKLFPDGAPDILTSLRDMAFDNSIYEKHKSEDVMTVSLLRYVSEMKLR
jgi:hypothetical protein